MSYQSHRPVARFIIGLITSAGSPLNKLDSIPERVEEREPLHARSPDLFSDPDSLLRQITSDAIQIFDLKSRMVFRCNVWLLNTDVQLDAGYAVPHPTVPLQLIRLLNLLKTKNAPIKLASFFFFTGWNTDLHMIESFDA